MIREENVKKRGKRRVKIYSKGREKRRYFEFVLEKMG